MREGRDVRREMKRDWMVIMVFVYAMMAFVLLFPVAAKAQEEPPALEALVAANDEYAVEVGGEVEVDLLGNDSGVDGAILCFLLDDGGDSVRSGGFRFGGSNQSMSAGRMTYVAPDEPGVYRWSYELCRAGSDGRMEYSERAVVTFEVIGFDLGTPPLPPEVVSKMRQDVREAAKDHRAALKAVRVQKGQIRKADSRVEKREERQDVKAAVKKSKKTGARLSEAREHLRDSGYTMSSAPVSGE